MSMRQYAESVYAGVLGKMIGVYLGRPVEGWPYEKIRSEFGEVDYYVHRQTNVPLVVADDDLSGTFGFFKSVADNGYPRELTARQIGDSWLNYIIEDKTILWWGGLGRSTEHTAFLRLKDGVPAPESGSAALNGKTLTEQIGAQIFMDAFAMTAPGDPERAARLVREAASVSHDGLALDAACYLGAMEALAFDVKDVNRLLDECLRFVSDPLLLKVIADVRHICAAESDWRAVRAWLDARYGYEQFAGPCHMVPNHAMVLASLLLGGDDFQRSVAIAASAGWDTDCNAGNVGCLNGIRLGLDGLSAGADFRAEPADRLYVVTADGGACVTDAVREARSIVRAAAAYRGEAAPVSGKRFGFEFRGSVQGFAPCPYAPAPYPAVKVGNLNETSDENGLLLECRALAAGVRACVSTPVFLEFDAIARNFSTIASPALYSSQTVTATVKTFGPGNPDLVFYILYYDRDNEVRRLESGRSGLVEGVNELAWRVPDTGGMPIFRLGFELVPTAPFHGRIAVLDADWQGAPESFAQRGMMMTSIWNLKPNWLHSWVSSAKSFEPDFKYTYCISHPCDNGVATTGTRDWTDYAVASRLSFNLHETGGLVVRSNGHRRYYAGVLSGGSAAKLIRRRDGEVAVLAETPFAYEEDRQYEVVCEVKGTELALFVDGAEVLRTSDPEAAYAGGAAGFLVERGTMVPENFVVERR